MNCDFAGITEKLTRATQNIRNLDGEITKFLDSGEYRVFSYEDKEVLSKAIEYHKHRAIPLRFSLLAGEIIHHLRPCLDHAVWQFSGEWYRRAHPTRIEFPIFEARPVTKKGGTGYERQVKGISSPGALMLIERLQPYYASNPLDSPLLIVHKLDIIDKHRELVLCGAIGAIPFPMELLDRAISYKRGEPGSSPVDFGAEFKRDPKIYPQVAFKQFGGRESEPLIQGIMELHNFIVDVMRIFDGLSKFKEPTVY